MRCVTASILVLAVCLAFAVPTWADSPGTTRLVRTWTNTAGKQTEGELVDLGEDTVKLKSASGKVYEVAMASLSPADQRFLASLKEGLLRFQLGGKERSVPTSSVRDLPLGRVPAKRAGRGAASARKSKLSTEHAAFMKDWRRSGRKEKEIWSPLKVGAIGLLDTRVKAEVVEIIGGTTMLARIPVAAMKRTRAVPKARGDGMIVFATKGKMAKGSEFHLVWLRFPTTGLVDGQRLFLPDVFEIAGTRRVNGKTVYLVERVFEIDKNERLVRAKLLD